MFISKPGLTELLERTSLTISFDQFLEHVKQIYDFAEIKDYEPISEGYENANIKIITDQGVFIIKIFLKEIKNPVIEGNIKVIQEAQRKNIPLTPLLSGKGGFLQELKQGKTPVKFYIMYYFEGQNFEHQQVNLRDILKVTEYIALFNTLNFPVVEVYDSWGNKNIIREYSQHKNNISEDVERLVFPVVKDVSRIDFANFSTSIIHGDLQRKHVLKNSLEEYCILDLGCMRNDAKIFDVSILLAWFCLGENTWDKKEEIVDAVLKTYTKIHQLSAQELHYLPILTKAAYAAYLLKTSFLIRYGDTSDETKIWYEKSRKMLQLMNEWEWKI